MKVLWIKSDFPLPADTGGKIRTLNLLKELAARCELTFLSYAPPELEHRWFDQLRGYGIRVETLLRPEERKSGLLFPLRVLSRLGSARPYIANKYITKEMTTRIKELSRPESNDIAVCDFLEMAWCLDYIQAIPRVLFEHNVETMIWRRYHEVERNPLKRAYFSFEKNRMKRFERESCRKSDHVLTVSANDGKLLQEQFDLQGFTEIPTGVDTEFFAPQPGEVEGRVVFCGSMDWMPNIDGFWWFYRDILPRLRELMPSVSFSVVGRRPGEDIVSTRNAETGIEITGTVSDVRPHVAAGQLYVVPLRVGGGTRIKIYEAMAMKRCVLSTSIGAEGLPLEPGKQIVIADDPLEFAEKANELLRDPDKRHRIAEAGHKLVTENFSWRNAADKLETALQKVLSMTQRADQK